MKVSKKELQGMSEELDKNYNDIAEDLEERGFEVERGVGLLGDAVSFLSDLQKAVKTIYALKEQGVSQTQLKKELEVFKTYVENKVKPVTEKSSMIDETIKDMEESVTSMITTSRELIEDTMDEKLGKTKELHEALAEIVKSIERDLMQQEKEIGKKADKEELKIKLEKKDLQDIEIRLSQKIIDDEEISKETTFSSDEIVKRIEDIKKNIKVGRGGGSTARIFIQDEGTDLGVANILDFKGAGVTVTEQGGKHIVTVPGGSSVGSFLDLTDVPSAYTGQGGKVVAVKADVSGLEFIAATSTDEKVKYDAGDPTAGYVADKIIAGTGISVAEGIGANENKLVITNEGGDVSKVGTPADNQVGVWTGDGTIEGTAKFTRDDSTKTMTLGDGTTEAYIYGKDKGTGTGDGGGLLFGGGAGGTTGGDGGNITFNGGNATAGNGNGGDIVFVGGYPQGAGKYGNVYLAEGGEDNYLQITPTLYVIENGYNKLYKFKGNGFYGIIDMASVATADKTFTFPNATGTVALTSDLTAYVTKALYDAHSILYATTDDTPVALTVGEQTVVGRVTGGNISAISIDSDLSSVSANDDTIPSAKATKAALDGKLPLAGGTMTGSITLDENAGVKLDSVLSADGKWTGITMPGIAGATVAFGDLITLDKDDSRRELVDISVAAAATGDARGILGMAVTTGNDGDAITILLQGTIRADANFPTLTIGAPVYASTTGDVVVAQPTTTDYVIRIIGYGLTADSLYFNPGNSRITHI